MNKKIRELFRKMRNHAHSAGKYVPSYDELNDLFDCLDRIKCPHCLRKMILPGNAGERGQRLTLQHDDGGKLRLICFSCNAAHGHSHLGDAFFDVPIGKKYCPSCKEIKGRDEFHDRGKTGYRREGYCRSCRSQMNKARHARDPQAREAKRVRCSEYYYAHRDEILAVKRKEYSKRKA